MVPNSPRWPPGKPRCPAAEGPCRRQQAAGTRAESSPKRWHNATWPRAHLSPARLARLRGTAGVRRPRGAPLSGSPPWPQQSPLSCRLHKERKSISKLQGETRWNHSCSPPWPRQCPLSCRLLEKARKMEVNGHWPLNRGCKKASGLLVSPGHGHYNSLYHVICVTCSLDHLPHPFRFRPVAATQHSWSCNHQ